jgi:PTH1 family peptidyl-tRNA hydrolase
MGYIAMKYLLVGLGNIGDDYVGTRHNIGFEVVESLGKKFGGEWKSVKHGSLCEVSHKGRKLLLLKPNTYMNLSGKAVSFWMQAEKIKLENVVIITDDLALPVAKLRLKSKGSDGGHNGLKSIQASLSTTNYARLRFGIGSEFSQGRQVDFVLGKFTTEERSSIDIAIDRAVEGTLQYCTLGAGFAMNYTNT